MARRRQRLAKRRQAVGLTQEALAEGLGVDRSTIVRWEAGTASPQAWMRPSLAAAIHITIEELASLLAGRTEQVEPRDILEQEPPDLAPAVPATQAGLPNALDEIPLPYNSAPSASVLAEASEQPGRATLAVQRTSDGRVRSERQGWLPDCVWKRLDVQQAIASYDVGAAVKIIREIVGLTQGDISAHTGLTQSEVYKLEAGNALTQIDKIISVLEGLGVPAELSPVRLSGASSLVAAPVEPDWDDPVAIATDVSALLASNTAPAAISAAEEALVRIIDEYEFDGPTGPARLALRARKLRSHLHGLLHGQQPPSHRTALFRTAARTSAVLGYMAVNAGHHGLAASYCTEAVTMAQDISDLETVLWTHGTRSLSAYYAGDFAKAAAWASAGIALAPNHPQAIRLHVNGLARALARQGDHAGTLRAIGVAEDLSSRHGVTTALTPCISLDPYGVTRTLANAITGHVALGETAEVLRYETEISEYVAASDSQWTHSLVRLDVATALLSDRHPDVEHAMVIGLQVLQDAEGGPLILSVVQRSHDLRRNAENWADVAAVSEYVEALRAWSQTPRVRQLASSATMPTSPHALGRTPRDAATDHIASGRVSFRPSTGS
ncbi:helix-turn-helix transcriptional regulator [Streptomyces phaeochromogenes]|uniref:helix-turn-helix transcriptional regulator n=1 Tax=Streptomyces phaeochromogenes TaxID=1923 RepID=UPI002DD91CB6|nr:helix-turn-helix transcriptional regulator [Streptomyces phaeochromogenes]WRZ34801.1 helix-turn-helix domain-containing protein [Streptomyces phaeochromogenes]